MPELWKSLQQLNKTFVANREMAQQRLHTQREQRPSTIIISCSDSRVVPEKIFAQKLGEAFVIRVAGEVADDVVIDSVEFAVNNFSPSLIVVLGHTECGAVIGALERLRKRSGTVDVCTGHECAVLVPIERAIIAAKINIHTIEAVSQAIRANVRYVADQLIANSPDITSALQEQKVALVGAEYSLDAGSVEELFVVTK